MVVWVTRVVCDMDKGTISVFGNASAHDSEEVEVESFLRKFLSSSIVLSLKNTHTWEQCF